MQLCLRRASEPTWRFLCAEQELVEHFREVECGGRVLTALTGSAPTAPEVADFLRDALLIPIIEGYGSTGARTQPSQLFSLGRLPSSQQHAMRHPAWQQRWAAYVHLRSADEPLSGWQVCGVGQFPPQDGSIPLRQQWLPER